jgi:NarL family two-component system sensor histidine kinase LiaS
MRTWLNHRLAFMKRLWCQLAVTFALLTFCAMTLLIATLYGLDDYNDFRRSISLSNVEERVASEKLIVAQAIQDAGSTRWWNKARDNIRDKLTYIDDGDGSSTYRITSSSLPEVYIQISDSNDHLLMSDPADLPERIATVFSEQKNRPAATMSVTRLAGGGPIWVDMSITDDRGGVIGHLRIVYIAEFSFWVQLQSIFTFLLYVWWPVLLLSIPIGIACGLVACHRAIAEDERGY